MSTNGKRTYVIALGGNSILRAGEKGTMDDQYANLWETSHDLLQLLVPENRIVITHGNGPQVGNLLLTSEMCQNTVPQMTLDICGAATQGFMGYMIQQTLANRLRAHGMKHNITTVVTQTIVDKDDPAFQKPTKPIGPFYDFSQAEAFRKERGWNMIEDSSRGYRRVVPSPIPIRIQEARIISNMLDAGEIVIAVGGGGIPVVREPDRSLKGVEAVIDKDMATSRLALDIGADVILCFTAVEKVYCDFGKPSQRPLDHLNVMEAKRLLSQGQFGIGSMEPKIKAAIEFLEGTEASGHPSYSPEERDFIITHLNKAQEALQGKTGTRITR